MIDAKSFGEDLAAIVKAATAPLEARINEQDQVIAGLEKALSSIEPARNGKDGADGKDGESVSVDDVMPDLKAHIDEYLASIPVPENGVDGKDGADGKDGRDGDAGRKGENGADGIGLAGALIDREGNLVITLANGEVKALGRVVGKDGANGAHGADGKDGTGFDDLEFASDEYGRPVAKFVRDGVSKEIRLPCIMDRGPFKAGAGYKKGDAVSYGGSLWIAQGDTEDRPDSGAGWRLAVKKGRDAREAKAKV